MARHKLQPTVIAALLSAGATEEIIADAHQILDACITRIGRPRKYKDRAERERAYRERKKKARDETRVETSPLPPEAYMTQNSIAMRAHYAARLRGSGPAVRQSAPRPRPRTLPMEKCFRRAASVRRFSSRASAATTSRPSSH